MNCKARLVTVSGDPQSIAAALEVDNTEMDGLRIDTICEEGKIITQIEAESIKTLVNTLDDIVSCQMVAEKLLKK